MDRNIQLTPHFQLKEFLRPEDPDPPPDALANLQELAQALEMIRETNGDIPLTITSGWRTGEHNAQIAGAARHSAHLTGKGADIVGLSPVTIDRLWKLWSGGVGLYSDGHTHVDIREGRPRWDERDQTA